MKVIHAQDGNVKSCKRLHSDLHPDPRPPRAPWRKQVTVFISIFLEILYATTSISINTRQQPSFFQKWHRATLAVLHLAFANYTFLDNWRFTGNYKKRHRETHVPFTQSPPPVPGLTLKPSQTLQASLCHLNATA